MNRLDDLDITCEADGRTGIRVDVHCSTPAEIDDVIEWLTWARKIMVAWERIAARRQATRTIETIARIREGEHK